MEQTAELAGQLSSVRALRGRPSAEHWLAWVIHAAEHGYQFDGLEYWESFAAQNPGWSLAEREQLRDWFKRFRNEYGGALPSGRWSENYTYICWPISHAVLPRDLQVQLAESIYNARYNLEIAPGLVPEALGALIARHTYNASTHYEGFLQRPELAGRIVRALLQGDDAERSPIYRPTLDRIVQDMATAGHAREWMKEARSRYRSASFRIRFGTRTPPVEVEGEPELPIPEPIRYPSPHFKLRQTGSARWKVYLAPPSMQALCSAHPEFRPHVERARVRLDCHGDSVMPASGLLVGQPAARSLMRWPDSKEVLLRLEPPLAEFDDIVSEQCRFPPTSLWVFRVRDNESADLTPQAEVLPGQTYVLLARDFDRIAVLGE